MNVILYLDKNRMSEETEIRRVSREDYRLIFANFSTDAGKWFGQPFPEPLPDETEEKISSGLNKDGISAILTEAKSEPSLVA